MDDFRLDMKNKRDEFLANHSEAHELKSQEIGEKLFEMIKEQEPQVVLAFRALGSEVDLDGLYSLLLEQGYPLYFPVTEADGVVFYGVASLEDFDIGRFQVREPKFREEIYQGQKAFCITPGMAFDKDYNRIGYGGGYYDRFFAAYPNVYKVGVGFDFQLVHQIRPKPWDVRLDAVVCL